MLCNVYLYGSLAKKYGNKFEFDINFPGDAARALAANFKDFYRDFKDNYYRVIVGDRLSGTELGEKDLDFLVGNKDVHFIPIVVGNKDSRVGGFVKYVLGAVIITTAILTGQYWAISVGVSFMLSGLAVLLTKPPKVNSFDNFEQPDARTSFIFNGPVNKNKQGAAVPLVFGRMRTGSVLVSAGIQTEKLL
jgi:predicted phage tail protein